MTIYGNAAVVTTADVEISACPPVPTIVGVFCTFCGGPAAKAG